MSENRTGILVSTAGAPIGEHLRSALLVLGVELQLLDPSAVAQGKGPPPFDAAVVVQDLQANEDPAWLEAVRRLSNAHLIPVVETGVSIEEVPKETRSLNWIRWPGSTEDRKVTEAAASAAVFTALHLDFERLRRHRDLEAETEAWLAANRDDGLLIDDRPRARHAAAHLEEANEDALTRPTPEMEQFVAASLAATRKARRKRRWRWIRRGGAASLALILIAGLIIESKANVANNRLATIVLGAWRLEGRPDRSAMVSAATIYQGRPIAHEMAFDSLLESLSKPWSRGVLGGEGPFAISDAVPVRGGADVLSVDGGGRVSMWNVDTATASWTQPTGLDRTPMGPVALIAASPDGSRVAVALGRNLVVARSAPWKTTHYSLPTEATDLEFDTSHSRFVIAGEKRLSTVAATGAGGLEMNAVPGKVLDLLVGNDGRVRALTQTGSRRLTTFDGVDFWRIFTFPPTALPVERGTLSPDGQRVVVEAGENLLLGKPGRAWKPLGISAAGAGVLNFLPHGVLALDGWARPLKLIDLDSGVDLGPACPVSVAIHTIHWTPAGDLMACNNGWVTELWSTLGQLPLSQPIRGLGLSRNATARAHGMVIRGGRDGVLRIAFHLGRGRLRRVALPVGTGAVTAVSLNRRDGHSILAGTSAGDVAEFDLRPSSLTATLRWHAPDGGAVQRVGWALQPGRLLIGTSGGLWWRPLSCDGCADPRIAITHARRRFWGCYESDALDFMSEETEQVLGLTACVPPPESE
jgi:hypothetical protein